MVPAVFLRVPKISISPLPMSEQIQFQQYCMWCKVCSCCELGIAPMPTPRRCPPARPSITVKWLRAVPYLSIFCTGPVYISPRPALARHQSKEIAFPPVLLSRVRLFSPQAHVHYELATVPLEPRRPNTDCIATSHPPLASTHTHTHTHSLSLSLSLSLSPSLSGSGITTTHTAPHPAQHAFSFQGCCSVYLILSHFRTHVRTPTPQYSGIPSY